MKQTALLIGSLLFTCFLLPGKLAAQEMLSLEDAVKMALEKNYDIRLSANNLQINKNNATIGNAGMLPAVSGDLSNDNSIQDSRQTQSSGEVRELNGVKNTGLNYGVNLNWTVFDGLGMFARYDQLKALEQSGEANLKLAVLTTLSAVIRTYYDLVQQQQQLQADRTALDFSVLRLEINRNRFEIGQAAKLEVLNAEVDYNTDTTNLLRQQELYRNTQIALNEVLARDVTTSFSVADTIIIDKDLLIEPLVLSAEKQNPALQAVMIGKRIAELDLKQIKSNRYPVISLNSGYGFTESKSALGFATSSTGKGFNYGVTASINIFNGFQQKRNEKNATLGIANAGLEYEKLHQNIDAQLTAAYQTYQTSLALVTLEENNQKIAQQNLQITLDKFKYGSITSLEFRQAQLNYVAATVRFSNAQYEAKLAEVTLKEIAGSLTL